MNMASSSFPSLESGFSIGKDVHRLNSSMLLYFRDVLGARIKSARQHSPPPQRAAGKLRVRSPAISVYVPGFSIVANFRNLCKLISSHSSHIFAT